MVFTQLYLQSFKSRLNNMGLVITHEWKLYQNILKKKDLERSNKKTFATSLSIKLRMTILPSHTSLFSSIAGIIRDLRKHFVTHNLTVRSCQIFLMFPRVFFYLFKKLCYYSCFPRSFFKATLFFRYLSYRVKFAQH